MLNWIVWNRTVEMYKMDLSLNNLQWLICHKTKPNLPRRNRNIHEERERTEKMAVLLGQCCITQHLLCSDEKKWMTDIQGLTNKEKCIYDSMQLAIHIHINEKSIWPKVGSYGCIKDEQKERKVWCSEYRLTWVCVYSVVMRKIKVDYESWLIAVLVVMLHLWVRWVFFLVAWEKWISVLIWAGCRLSQTLCDIYVYIGVHRAPTLLLWVT